MRLGTHGRRRRQPLAWIASAIAVLALVGCDEDPQRAPVDPCTEQPCSVEAVVTHLGDAYAQRDYERFSRLLHDDFTFVCHYLYPPYPQLPEGWGTNEELRIHRRMLAPTSIPSGDPPVPEQLWLTAVTIDLQPMRPWAEVFDYYQGPSNPIGLDSTRWKVWATEYISHVLFKTRGETDYQVNARNSFVVAQDLTKAPADAAAFSLYRWHDLGPLMRIGAAPPTTTVEPGTWTAIKLLYGWY